MVNKNEMEQQDLLYVLLESDYMLHKLFLQHFVSEKKKKKQKEKQNVKDAEFGDIITLQIPLSSHHQQKYCGNIKNAQIIMRFFKIIEYIYILI